MDPVTPPKQIFNQWLIEHVAKDPLFTEHEIHGYDLHGACPESTEQLSVEEMDKRYADLEAFRQICHNEIVKQNPDPEHIVITDSLSSKTAGGPWPSAWFGIDIRVINAKDHTATMQKLNQLMAQVIETAMVHWPKESKFGCIVHAEVKSKTLNAELEMRHHFAPHVCHLAGEKFELRNPWRPKQAPERGLIALQKAIHKYQKEHPYATTEQIHKAVVVDRDWKRPIEGVLYKLGTVEKYKYKG